MNDSSNNPVVVLQTRGPRIETRHRAAIAIADGRGLIASCGDVDAPSFLRSGAKFFQAIPCLTSGAAERFHLGDRALALACGSHNAEPEHVAIARRMLAAAGLSENDLACGPHPPMHPATAARLSAEHLRPTRIHNNCSGKHAGMMLSAVARGESPRGYTEPEHPIQREIRRILGHFAGVEDRAIEHAIDGCGVPTFILPLKHSARAFARFGRPDQEIEPELAAAALRLGDAIARRPNMVAGEDRLCSAIARVTGGRILAKVGADGFYGVAIRDQGQGLALHVDDGATAISERLMVAILRARGHLHDEEFAALEPWCSRERRNCAGDLVGSIEFDLAGIQA
ncbi:MAG: asparaginase [Planctomycetes bacterium]|nr:asparaginase [Planctomycetota bacterium]